MKPEIHIDEPDGKGPATPFDCDMWIPERELETEGKLYVAWTEWKEDYSYQVELSDLISDLLMWTGEPEYYDLVASALEFQAKRMRAKSAQLRADATTVPA
jgi:hypothetical protein